MIDQAMILAAGFGTRMRPLTETTPKPLLCVGGKSILEHLVQKLLRIGVTKIVINGHYLAEQIEDFVEIQQRLYPECSFVFSNEDEILETGGGVLKALSSFENKPFFVLNGDIFWTEAGDQYLRNLEQRFFKNTMQACLMMVPRENAANYDGPGDFNMDQQGHLLRRQGMQKVDYVFGGAQIMVPQSFVRYAISYPEVKKFSNNLIWDQVSQDSQLFGMPFKGQWYHIGTPEDLRYTDAQLKIGAL